LLIFCLIITGLDSGTCAYAQAPSASASASATILKTIQISTIRDMDFGILAAGEIPGTVILAPTAASTRTTTGGVTLPSGSTTVQSAKFIVTGTSNCTYTIVLPSETIILSNGVNNLSLDSFTSTPSGSGLITAGSQPLFVGATLNVNAHQQPGLYKSTKDLEIIVNYY
jgi:hypothetical protein